VNGEDMKVKWEGYDLEKLRKTYKQKRGGEGRIRGLSLVHAEKGGVHQHE